MAIMTIGRLLLRPASGFTVGIEVEADIDFFCFVVTPDEAVSRIIVVAKREFDDQHRVVVTILDDQIVNAWGPVFDIPERELDTRPITWSVWPAAAFFIAPRRAGFSKNLPDWIDLVIFRRFW